MNHYCDLARKTLTHFVTKGRKPEPATPAGKQAGCFVSYHNADGELRGCIGTIEPQYGDLSEEIVENAIAAASRDPRFPPIQAGELPGLEIEVSVMNPPEPIDSAKHLDPKRYGVVIKAGARRGVLLPGLEGVDTVDRQLSIVRRKARISEHEPVQIWRFEVEKHHERRA